MSKINTKTKTITPKENKFENGLFIFRRDLRIIDNISLCELSKYCNNLFTIFIFTPEQITNKNTYKSNNAVLFMIESLKDLHTNISTHGGKLFTFYGDNMTIIKHCIHIFNINVLGFNLDCTPYAKLRDNEIITYCEKNNIKTICHEDYYLHDLGSITTGTGSNKDVYQKFTPYYLKAHKQKVNIPISPTSSKYTHFTSLNSSKIMHQISLDDALKKFTKPNPNRIVFGGRDLALKQLKHAIKIIKSYDATRNNLNKETTQLSAAIKFGCLSVREVYKAFHNKEGLIKQLYWRDFYANILYKYPQTLGHSLKEKYNKIKWHHNSSWFDAWCQGKTGFPIIDAGMRQMNESGYMHNRARLLVASFLVKTLLIDWRYGERYFAQMLTDYDVANNNQNWQWIAGGGADSQPFFRIFNPWRQTIENDPDCEYIKKWIPELQSIPIKDLLKWETKHLEYNNIKYPYPIVNYTEQKEKALKMYRDALY